MSQLVRSIVGVMVLAAAGVAFVAGAATTRAAVAPIGGSNDSVMLAGGQLAVVVATFHNAQHTAVTTVTVGTTVHASVTVAGGFGTPTGTVFGSMYANGTCSGTPVKQSGPGILGGTTIDLTSMAYAPVASGKLSVSVYYEGDSTYAERTSACAVIDVTKATPSVGMVIHGLSHDVATSFGYGDTVHPYVTVNSRVSSPSGYFTVSWWKNGTCAGAKTDESINIGPGVGGHADLWNVYAKSASPVGSFSFKVHYQGDAGFKPGDSACVPYTVTKLAPDFEAQVHNYQHLPVSTLPLGAQVHPFAHVAAANGGPTPTGTVTVRRYSDGDCTNEVGSNTLAAADQMEMTSFDFTSGAPAVISWRITYSGDPVYRAAGTAICFTRAWKAPSTLSFDMHDINHDVISTATPQNVHFELEVNGSSGVATGDVSVVVFQGGTCLNFGTTVASTTLSGGTAHPTMQIMYLPEGTFSLKAIYGGDTRYFGDSACKTVTITAPATPAPTAKPTAAPTAKPTAAPTAKPTPHPTAAPTAAPTQAASSSAQPSSEPTAQPPDAVPAGSTEPTAGASPEPDATALPGATAAPAMTDGTGAGSGTGVGSGTGSPTSPSGEAGSGSIWIVLLLILVLLGFVAGFAMSRRRPGPEAEAA